MQPRLCKFISKVHSRKGCILEAGCGAGRIVFELSRSASSSTFIIGLDFSLTALYKAKKQSRIYGRAFNQDFLLADIRNLPLKTSTFDFILSLGVIEHFKNPTPLLAEMRRVLKNDGKLFLETPNRKVFKLSSSRIQKAMNLYGHHDFYTPAELTNLLQKLDFSILDARSLDFSWGVLMWYDDCLRRFFSKYKYLDGLICVVVRALTFPLNFIFHESGFYSIVIGYV